MDFFKRLPIPSPQAAANVAWETMKAYWPENSPCMELIKRRSGTDADYGTQPGDNEMATMAQQGYQEAGANLFKNLNKLKKIYPQGLQNLVSTKLEKHTNSRTAALVGGPSTQRGPKKCARVADERAKKSTNGRQRGTSLMPFR